jgi:hypothetical protein
MSKECNYKIGSLVVLNSGPYLKASHIDKIKISGNQDFVSPIMVITSILKSQSKKLIQNSIEFDNTDMYQYKCIWFTSKTMTFEETWFKGNQIRALDANETTKKKNNSEFSDSYKDEVNKDNSGSNESIKDEKSKELPKIEFGDILSFRTNTFELKKLKSFKEYRDNENYYKTNSLTSFTSPPLTCIGFQINESKDPLFSSKNSGDRIRWESERLAKVKYYNALQNKYSEVLIPIEALEIVPKIGKEALDKVIQFIQQQVLIRMTVANTISFIRIKAISTNSGYYFIDYVDELTGKNFHEIYYGTEEMAELDDKVFDEPLFDFTDDESKREKKIKDGLNDFYQIKYENRNGIVSNRFIKLKNYIEIHKHTYLLGYCYSRSDDRHFRLDRIFEIKRVSNEDMRRILSEFKMR